jgi:hypothetical protein
LLQLVSASSDSSDTQTTGAEATATKDEILYPAITSTRQLPQAKRGSMPTHEEGSEDESSQEVSFEEDVLWQNAEHIASNISSLNLFQLPRTQQIL